MRDLLSKLPMSMVVFWGLFIVADAAVFCAVVYIVFHFVSKFW